MKLKTPLLMILLLPLLTHLSYAQMQPELQERPDSAYGIESEKFYPGTLVLELMEAAEAEIEAAVSEAYAEGYKAAMLRFVPELASLNAAAEAMQWELDALRKKQRLYWPSFGIAAGVSFAAGFFLHSLTVR